MINRVNFEGNSEVKDKDLEKEVELKERTMFTRAKVQSDVQRIITVYRRQGFYSARVEPKIIRLPQNRVDLVYEITKSLWGDKARAALDAGHAKGKVIRKETALTGLGIPLHAGAEKFYKEAGLVK